MVIGGLPFMSLPDNERHPQQLTQHLLRHLSQQGLYVPFKCCIIVKLLYGKNSQVNHKSVRN